MHFAQIKLTATLAFYRTQWLFLNVRYFFIHTGFWNITTFLISCFHDRVDIATPVRQFKSRESGFAVHFLREIFFLYTFPLGFEEISVHSSCVPRQQWPFNDGMFRVFFCPSALTREATCLCNVADIDFDLQNSKTVPSLTISNYALRECFWP